MKEKITINLTEQELAVLLAHLDIRLTQLTKPKHLKDLADVKSELQNVYDSLKKQLTV